MNNERLQKKLDYEEVKEEKARFLESKHTIVLATSYQGRVTARTVTFASKGLHVYFMSWARHTKCAQIRGNPRVALCRDNVQMEGVAEILGDPLDEPSREYAETYRSKLPRDFEMFAHQAGMVMVRVVPALVTTFVRIGGRLYLECLDLEKETAYRRGFGQ